MKQHLRKLLLLTFFAVLLGLGKRQTVYAANTISYEELGGGTVTGTDQSTDADFTNAKAAPEMAGKTILCFLYETCRSAASPAVATQDMVMTIVTEESVGGAANHGDFTAAGAPNAIWFVYNNKLYITTKQGAGVVTVADTTGGFTNTTTTQSFTGTKSEIYYPTFFATDLDGSGAGIQAPTVGDAKTYAEDEFYIFKDVATDTYEETLGSRDNVTMAARVDHHSAGNMKPGSVGWIAMAPNITDVYISDDIALSGNMNGLFNANFTYIKETGDATNDMKNSIYTALKNVYLYCDMSQVTGMAGMFARCNALENIYVRPGTTKLFTNATSTAYMFYGDKLLVNGDGKDSLVDAIDLSGAVNLVSTSFMFGGCEAIVHPKVSNYRMNGVMFADGMFFGAKNADLTSNGSGATHDIQGWNLSSCVNATAMFSGGDSDGVIDLDDPTKSMDPGIGDLSEYGNVITGTVDMTGWDMDACVMAYMMFSRNGGINGVVLDNSYALLEDASGMFLRCDNLINVTMNSSMPALKNSTVMFKLAGSKTSVAQADIKNWNVPSLKNADFMFYGSGFRTIDTTGISNLAALQSAKGMFGNNRGLTSLGAGALGTVTFGAITDANMMFIDDEALVKVDTSGWNMANVTDLGFMFQNTPALTEGVDISGWAAAAPLTNMECFAENNGMPSFNYSAWDTRNVTSFAFAFANNENLTSVTPANSSNALFNATNLFGMFANDPKLTTVGAMPAGNNLIDVGGMFANDTALTTVDVSNLLKSNGNGKFMEYFMKNCKSIPSLNISGWNTANVTFMQGFLDNANKLATLTTGNTFSGSSATDTSTMFRNCYVLKTSDVTKVLNSFSGAAGLVDIYEMLKNCYALGILDMSGMNLSATTDLRRVACMENNAGYTTTNLKTLILPSSILTAPGVKLKDNDNTSINMFWVTGDETTDTDDLVTTLFLDGTPGANIKAYNFGGSNGDNDNRGFITYNGRTINGNAVGSYILSSSTDTAAMKIDVTSSLYTGGTDTGTATVVAPTYTWTKGGSSIAGADADTYSSSKSGSYAARVVPGILTGSNSSKSASFILGSSITGIEATYKGSDVAVGDNYLLSDVAVNLVDSDGNKTPLSASDYTVDSQTVTKKGNNTYTVTYTSGTNKYTATITVPGYRKVGSIEAIYSGPSVVVGKDYDSNYVTVKAYYADDKTKTEGFQVKPTSLSSTKVTAAGDNTYTATYTDKNTGDTFSANYKVNGYKPINSISATYTGDKVKVGEQYDKGKVKVTLYYADGSGSDTTTNFSVDSQTVTYEGGNSFTASYRDPFGNVYTAGFSVPGYKDSSSNNSNNTNNSPSNTAKAGPTASTVRAPVAAGNSFSASTVTAAKQGTSTGVVQTGTTGKAVLYLIAILVLVGAILVVLKIRKNG